MFITRILLRILEAGKWLGIPHVPDINAPDTPSVASIVVDFAIDRQRHRVSTFSAFLPKSLAEDRKSDLKICTGSFAKRVVVERGAAGNRATGVYFQANTGSNKEYFAKARREIVLCAGAIATPQILLLRCA